MGRLPLWVLISFAHAAAGGRHGRRSGPRRMARQVLLSLHPPLGWCREATRDAHRAALRRMVRDAGPRRYCLMISEDVPPNWQETVPLVLETLAGSQ